MCSQTKFIWTDFHCVPKLYSGFNIIFKYMYHYNNFNQEIIKEIWSIKWNNKFQTTYKY